jgi:cytidylate kinase
MAVITISRLYGSGGSEVAQRVADTLGWELLDNSIVDAVAARLDMSVYVLVARTNSSCACHSRSGGWKPARASRA